MIDRYDYWTRPLSLRRMMDRLFEDAFVLPAGRQSADAGDHAAGSHTMNVYEEGDNLVFEAHLPGYKPDDIDISVEQGILTIRCQSKAEDEKKERNYFVRQHRTSSFVRSLRLPDSVDVDAARATFEHGVLSLAFPKVEPARPRRVPIAMAGQASLGSAPDAQPVAEATASSSYASADAPAPSAGQAGHTPAPHNGEATSDGRTSPRRAASKAAKAGSTGGKASRGKAAAGKGSGRKSAKEAVGAGA